MTLPKEPKARRPNIRNERVRGGKVAHPSSRLRAIRLGDGLPPIPSMVEELEDMTDVLLGRKEPPLPDGYLSLMETADAYFARASELTMKLQRMEREGQILRGSKHYLFRTGELRTFLEMAKRAADLGSRRLTGQALLFDMERYGRESLGD